MDVTLVPCCHDRAALIRDEAAGGRVEPVTATVAEVDVVERFLACMVDHDWRGLGACVTDDVVRVGPYGDTYCGRDDYVAFVSGLLPTLARYEMKVHRVVYTADERVSTAELSETVEVDGRMVVTPESLVFDIDDRGRIAHLAVYVQRQP
jgi:ketosteroid isomerase-like protein